MTQEIFVSVAMVAIAACGVGLVIAFPATIMAGLRGRTRGAMRGTITMLLLVVCAVVAATSLGSSPVGYLVFR